MHISMIAAMAKDRVIGKDNTMPWHLPADLAFFKKNTLKKPVIMGRNTYESIGRPLPGRQNIVLTRNTELVIPGVNIVNQVDEALALAGDVEEVMIIGGAKVYEQFLPLATRLYITEIDLTTEGDTFFPDFQSVGPWQEEMCESHQSDDKNMLNYKFLMYSRQNAINKG